MRMRQSLAEFESAFVEEAELDRALDQARLRQAAVRTRRRHLDQVHRRGTMRFVVLVLVLLATAVGVTVAMFQALYMVMG
jgi:hypothetical protein